MTHLPSIWEIGRYLDVYRFVTGPVGSDLSCHVTYNRRNILSFYFSGPPIRYRAYSVKSINDGPSWKEVERYAFVSPLWGGADPTHHDQRCDRHPVRHDF